MKQNSSSILQELESDDELPNSYIDTSVLPAYLDDNRFNEIKFPWLNNINLPCKAVDSNTYLGRRNCLDKLHFSKGVLKGQDLYCLKSVEKNTCSSTLIWFINFLLHKDLQSHYKYLKSCLIDEFHTSPDAKKNDSKIDNTTNNRFKVIIKE